MIEKDIVWIYMAHSETKPLANLLYSILVSYDNYHYFLHTIRSCLAAQPDASQSQPYRTFNREKRNYGKLSCWMCLKFMWVLNYY